MRIRENNPGKFSKNEKVLPARRQRRHQTRVRLTDWERYLDAEDWDKLRALSPVPLGWKRKPGLLFSMWLESYPRQFYLPTKQAAEFLGQSVKTLNQWRKQRIGPEFTRVGERGIRYKVASLLDWLVEQRAKGAL